MRNLVKTIAIAAVFFFSVGAASAQQKLGHINSQAILSAMPELKTADEAFETFRKTKLSELEGVDKERQAKVATFQQKYQTLTEANQEVLGKELEGLNQEIQQIEQRMGELDQPGRPAGGAQRQGFSQSVTAQAEIGTKAVGKAQGYAFASDTADQALVYSDGREGIPPVVKTRLGNK